MGSKENGVRKVLTMWKVRPSLLTCWERAFQMTPEFYERLCSLTFSQEIPSTCRDALTFTLTQSRHSDSTGASCGGSVCVVTQDVHRINLRIFRGGTLFAADSVYVPAVGASECCLQTDSPQPGAHKWLNKA